MDWFVNRVGLKIMKYLAAQRGPVTYTNIHKNIKITYLPVRKNCLKLAKNGLITISDPLPQDNKSSKARIKHVQITIKGYLELNKTLRDIK